MEELRLLRNLLKAHKDFYEYEIPKDLKIELTMDQVKSLYCALSMILREDDEE